MIVELQSLLGTQGQGQELLTAGAFISMMVPMIVFFTLQRYFVRGPHRGRRQGVTSDATAGPPDVAGA